MGQTYPRFTPTEINWGLAYAKKEYRVTLDPVLLYVLASMIRHFMHKHKRPFDDVRYEILMYAYEAEFKRVRNIRKLRDTAEAYANTLGKMFNNRKNIRHVNFTPTERVSSKRDTKPRVITLSTGQRVLLM